MTTSPSPAGRRTGTMTPVDVSLCAQATTSAETDAGTSGAAPAGASIRSDDATCGAALVTAVTWSGAFLRKQALETGFRIRDARTGLDTASDFPEAERPENPAHDDAMHYMGVSPRIFRKLVRDLGVAPADYTFVDLGCGKGAALLMAADQGFASVVGVELNASYLRAATSGTVTAVATPAKIGRSLSTFLVEVTDDAGRVTATARLTCMTLDG